MPKPSLVVEVAAPAKALVVLGACCTRDQYQSDLLELQDPSGDRRSAAEAVLPGGYALTIGNHNSTCRSLAMKRARRMKSEPSRGDARPSHPAGLKILDNLRLPAFGLEQGASPRVEPLILPLLILLYR
jgi:hypothetical protein